MSKCPSCDAELKQDFGMVTCHGCKSVLMIDISGHVSQGVESTGQDPDGGFNENTDQSFDPVEAEGLDDEPTQFDSDATDSEFEESYEALDSDQTGTFEDSEESNFHDDSMVAASGEEADDFEPIESDENHEHDFQGDQESNDFFTDEMSGQSEPLEDNGMETADTSSEEDYSEDVETFPMASQPDPDPVDITEFANSEDSSLEEGDLLYDLVIGRLDSKDLKESLKYVLMDEKLKLNHLSYLKKIKGGKLLIPDLNPIKAKRIVEQLQYLDLDIKWKQKRVIMETVEPEMDEEGEMLDDAEI